MATKGFSPKDISKEATTAAMAHGFIAWDHGYLSLAWLRVLASAVLAILLWWLVLLGVNLHIHA